MRHRTVSIATIVIVCVVGLFSSGSVARAANGASCECDYSSIPGAVHWGTEREITAEQLASFAAPVFWFSPEEPSLGKAHGTDIMAPEAFPFESADGPVVYFQLKEVIKDTRESAAAYRFSDGKRESAVIDLQSTALLVVEYYAYFADESGFGAHQHDVEPVEFKLGVALSDREFLRGKTDHDCDQIHYVIIATRISAKAHGIEWFWNIVDVDPETEFPMTILVEEGKHGLATDKNADGYFTPSFDVNVRTNDAWGVRDIIRSGGLYSGGYQAWMAKVRHPRDRVFPPLPDDSPLHAALAERQEEYTRGNAIYDLRPFPTKAQAEAWDQEQGSGSNLKHFLDGKEMPDGPEEGEISSLDQAFNWIDEGALKRSFSASFYADGGYGFSWAFPFFVVKNFEDPMSGGYILQRMYLKGDSPKKWDDLTDFGWMALYTPSASRWIDTYFAAGAEWHDVDSSSATKIETDFVLETGFKFRAQIGSSPVSFLSFLTDFWGVRFGVKNYGFFDIERLTYVAEIGAGSF